MSPSSLPLLGCIADDFTGASDLANTLATAGMRTVQLVGLPSSEVPDAWQAAVISLKSRSIPSGDAVEQSLAALDWLRARGCRQFLFKYCSTFDSTPEGNIGPVGEALAKALGAQGVVACPAFPETGRTVYQGHLFVGDRLLSESGLEHHPLNPMTDPDLRRWLRLQTHDPVGHVAHSAVLQGAAATREALRASASRGERLVIVDALDDRDLREIGTACADAPLITGGSGIARGLPANYRARGLLDDSGNLFEGLGGPGVVLAGSCSSATRQQIEHFGTHAPALGVDPDALMAGRVGVADLVAFANANRNSTPLIYSSATPDRVAAAQARYGREAVSLALESLFADIADRLAADGFERLVVAGGETSGAVVSALRIDAFAIGPEIDPGVPALRTLSGRPLAIALKSGNFGTADFFEKALRTLGSRS
jgi:3-dehydrotetronate 4-kinase